MKRLFLFISAFVLISISVNSQEFKAGAIGGATFSQVHGDSYVGFNKMGLVTGLYVSRSLNPDWGAQFEIVYKQKGSRHNPNESTGDYNLYKLSFDYIEIPLLVKLNMTKVSLEAGVAFGILINSKEEDQYGIVEASIPFEDYEFSGIIGVNYHFYNRLYANLRWSYSFTRVRKAYGGEYDDQYLTHWMDGKFGQYNHVVSLSVYYEFEKLF